MSYVSYNINPLNKLVIDCTVRAISTIMRKDWDTVYIGLCLKGYEMKDMPNSNSVWGAYLRSNGYYRELIPNTCPDCYRVRDFCYDHPQGSYLLATGAHVIAVIDGDYYDTWDSGDEIPIYYWRKENSNAIVQQQSI